MPRTESAIRLERVDAHRRKRLALEDVTFEIPAGTVTSVVGPNGGGKSTLLGLISGRLRPSRGRVEVEGEAAEVLQTTDIDPQVPLTVEDVVRQGRYRARGLLRPMTKSDRRIVEESLERVDLIDHRRTPIHALSGGQRQRALLAQGLAQKAPILLLDEPTTGVDVPTRERLRSVIREVADEGVTVVYATHSVREAAEAELTVALCCACICCAPTPEALANPQVTEFLGIGPRPDRR
ncbi:MAG: metal ABC transporter ATP-binding protein [Actinomycetota bacterium]